MKKIKLLLLPIFLGILCILGQGQEANSKMKIDCATLRMIEQKPAPKLKEKTAPDVIVMTPDDIHIRFELKNNCNQTIYYLAQNIPDDKKTPAGFFLYRNKKEDDWKSRSPAWRREGSLTDPYLYHWMPIEAGKSIEFEYSDLSSIEGERSVAIYVSYSTSQEERIELMAFPFTIKKA
ncbi:MAG TPA: hypothetical protein VK468_07045 [Pyrinomonadaceae bacterium]|nr:hypothetical protein [Pyrinomonadaceae bacterium]